MGVEVNLVILSLGANLGDPKRQITSAYDQIQSKAGVILLKSSFYSTEPWGFKSDSLFINSAILIETKLQKTELLNVCQQIEKDLGRSQKENGQYESRLIDIDLIDYSGEIVDGESLVLPHYLMHERLFVLEPVNEILPNWIHPVLRKNCEEMIAELLSNRDEGERQN